MGNDGASDWRFISAATGRRVSLLNLHPGSKATPPILILENSKAPPYIAIPSHQCRLQPLEKRSLSVLGESWAWTWIHGWPGNCVRPR
jgi:hypothetical protein